MRLYWIIFLTGISFLLMGNSMHPVHVTVTNMDFNAKQRSFDISIKIFADDVEGAIQKKQNVSLFLGKSNENKEADKYLEEYIRNNFNLSINSDKFAERKLKMVRKEMSEGAAWLYFTYSISGKIKTLQVQNSLLNDYYPDMTNLVIIKVNETETGYSLNKGNTSFKISSSS